MALFLLALTLKALGNEKLCSDAQGEVSTLVALAHLVLGWAIHG